MADTIAFYVIMVPLFLMFNILPVAAIIGIAWMIGRDVDRSREAERRSGEIEREAMSEMTSRSDD